MSTTMQFRQRGLRGLFRFTNAEAEGRYRARMLQWCFWPVVVRLWSNVVLDAVSLVSSIGVNQVAHVPWYVFWMVGMDVAILLLLALIHGCQAVRSRHIVPLFCVYLWFETVRYGAFIRLQTTTWAQMSYAYIVPAAHSVFVEGPAGKADISGLLEGHFGALAAYRSAQIEFTNTLAPCVYTMLLGLNGWSIATLLWIPTAYVIGLATTPQISTTSLLLWTASAYLCALCSLLFAGAFERMQRRYFQAEQQLQWELEASQMADSVLNHSLKNALADVAGNIEMFLAGVLQAKGLEDCITTLRRGMRSCKERQAYLRLVSGQYQPVLNAIPLQDFGRQLLAGRRAAGRFPACTVFADHMLLTIIFDNALNNAARHGDPQNPDVRFTIEEIPADVCRDLPEGCRRFCFQVTNVAHPGRPELTPPVVERLFAGGAESWQQSRRCVRPALSDGIGLAHCVIAAKLGGVALSLTQEDDLVTFAGTLDAEVQESPTSACAAHPELSLPTDVPAFPAGLLFVVLDDSAAAQRLLKFHIEKWCRPAAVTCLGTSAADVAAFLAKALLADVVIVDQHLDWGHDGCLGSDLVRQLRRLRYGGFVCIRSANDSPADQELYRQAGADCVLGKDLLGPVMVRLLQSAYAVPSGLEAGGLVHSTPLAPPRPDFVQSRQTPTGLSPRRKPADCEGSESVASVCSENGQLQRDLSVLSSISISHLAAPQ